MSTVHNRKVLGALCCCAALLGAGVIRTVLIGTRNSPPDEALHSTGKTEGENPSQTATAPQSASSQPGVLEFLHASGRVHEGQPKPGPSTINPQTFKGRTVSLKAALKEVLKTAKEGVQLGLPGFDGEQFAATVKLRVEDGGWVRLGGRLADNSGTFSLHLRSAEVFGTVQFPRTGMAWEIRTEPDGEILLVERTLSQIVCWPAAPTDFAAAAAASDSGSQATSAGTIPQVNTRPGARGVIYLHFGGGQATDPDWNGGEPLDFLPSGLDATGILEVVSRVAEDYAPFDFNITTRLADYDGALPGRRMRVNITPTNTLLKNSGGISLIGSWRESGKSRSTTVPAWVFNSSVKSIAEAVSHEVGHTLGLSHDGTNVDAYYGGNGGTLTSPTSWAPIMGNSYFRSVTQWSKGEYPGANNTEDDLAIIAQESNNVGYASEQVDAEIDTLQKVRLLNITGGTFALKSVLRRANVPNSFQFTTHGGSFSVQVKPAVSKIANADLELELVDDSGATIQKNNLTDTLESVLQAGSLAEGTYRLMVRAAPNADPDSGDVSFRYPAYGSLGAYQLSGTVQNAVALPVLLSATEVAGTVGLPLSHRIVVSNGTSIEDLHGSVPPGMLWNAMTKTLSGTPTGAGDFPVEFQISNSSGSLTRRVLFSIETAGLPLTAVGEASTALWTSLNAPWSSRSVSLPIGLPGVAAASGRISNNGTSRLRFKIPANQMVSFWWKTSSEAGHDLLTCRLNGALAKDSETAQALSRSGETDWVKQCLHTPPSTPSTVEFVYSKDASLSQGMDRGWVYDLKVGALPIFKKQPTSLRLKRDDKAFSLEASVESATSYQWKKNGLPLSDGTLGFHVIAGASTPKLQVSGVSAADSGAYTLEARNEFDKVTSRKADVTVPLPPVLLENIMPPADLHAGDTLTLSARIGGATPIIINWSKDGSFMRRVNGTTLQIPNVTILNSGTYTFSIFNAFGAGPTGSVSVTVLPARK